MPPEPPVSHTTHPQGVLQSLLPRSSVAFLQYAARGLQQNPLSVVTPLSVFDHFETSVVYIHVYFLAGRNLCRVTHVLVCAQEQTKLGPTHKNTYCASTRKCLNLLLSIDCYVSII